MPSSKDKSGAARGRDAGEQELIGRTRRDPGVSTERVLHLVVAWLRQSYRDGRVPVGLLSRTLARSLGIEPQRVDEAVNSGVKRRLLQSFGTSADGVIVSLAPAGAEMADALIGSLGEQVHVGALAPAADALVDQIVLTFATTLRKVATEWAREAASDVEPIHVILAARSIATGPLLAAIDAIDERRDKSGDAAGEQKLLALLWKRRADE